MLELDLKPLVVKPNREELAQSTAMWWSSNSQQLAFYRFDESQVPDYYLALNQTNIQDTLHAEAYAKTGGTNPVVDLGMGEVTDLQGAVVYLAASVSDFMTGHDIVLDGGLLTGPNPNT